MCQGDGKPRTLQISESKFQHAHLGMNIPYIAYHFRDASKDDSKKQED